MSARQVYHTLELRHAILESADFPTLAMMLRLEKAVMASVAAVLYKEVSRPMVQKMSRATPRRSLYCDAVRILEWSSWNPSHRLSVVRGNGSIFPNRFDPEAFLRKAKPWMKKFPNLRTIRYLYPDNGIDDAYIVHTRDNHFSVELESHIRLVLTLYPCDEVMSSLYPTPPSHPLMAIRQTVAVTLDSLPSDPDWTSEQSLSHVQRWQDWLYGNPGPHCRMTSLRNRGGEGGDLSFDSAMENLALRKANDCEPLTQFRIDFSVTPPGLRQLASALGPEIRTLSFNSCSEVDFGDLQSCDHHSQRRLSPTSIPTSRLQYEPRNPQEYSSLGWPTQSEGTVLLDYT